MIRLYGRQDMQIASPVGTGRLSGGNDARQFARSAECLDRGN